MPRRPLDGITGITTEWLFEHVVPNMRNRYANDSRLCRVMALPLLYICLSSNEDVYVPTQLRNRVRNAYAQLGNEEEQPIKKIPLHIYRLRGVLMIDPVDTAVAGPNNGPVVAGGGGGMSNELAHTILVRMNRLEQAQTQHQVSSNTQVSELRSYVGSQFRMLNNNIRAYGGTIQGSLVRQRASNQGQTMLGQADASQAPPMVEFTTATLSNNPRTLIELWNEYKFGINGRKPAEQFTTHERTSNKSLKQKYWRRNHVWQAMARLVRGGKHPSRAALEIRRVYGFDVSVTRIIEAMIRDKKNHTGGIHPNLR